MLLTSHRRLKNVLVLLEWLPAAGGSGAGGGGAADAEPAALSDAQRGRLQRLARLYSPAASGGGVGAAELRRVLADCGLRADQDARDAAAIDAAGRAVPQGGVLGVEAFCELMRAGDFLRGEPGRFWAAISLREAECLRAAMHVAADARTSLLGGGGAVGLRLADGLLLDAVGGGGDGSGALHPFPPPSQLQLGSALAAFAFIDSRLSYPNEQIRLLLRLLRTDGCSDRRRWFAEVCACRRRPQALLERRRTNLEAVLATEDEYPLLIASAARWRLGNEMASRQLGVHDLYHAFNGRRDGLLSCGELAAGLDYLGISGYAVEDVHALVRSLDGDGDGLVTLDE